MGDKTMTVELTEQDSAIILIALELREMRFLPQDLSDRRRLPELKKELRNKHTQVFDHTATRQKK